MGKSHSASKPLDVIVVGSGFGGSVSAARFAEAGLSVMLLERGPWRDTLPVQKAGIDDRSPLPRTGGAFFVLRSINLPFGPKQGVRLNKTGLLELWVGDGVKAICSSGVGGGSHVWAGGLAYPEPGFWDSHTEGLSDDLMAPHYKRILKELCAVDLSEKNSIPNHAESTWRDSEFFSPLLPGEQPAAGILLPEKEGVFTQVCNADGIVRQPVNYREPNGMFGSPGGSKSTVDALYLLPAIKKGLDVRAMHELRTMARLDDGSYRLGVQDLENKRSVVFEARRVVLAAGTMNTHRILLSAMVEGGIAAVPNIGEGLSTNGDVVGSWDLPLAHRSGSTLGTPSLGRVKIKGYEDHGYIVLGAGEPLPVPRFMREKVQRKAAKKLALVAMFKDEADGKIWQEDGRMKFSFSLAGSPGFQISMAALDSLAARSGTQVAYDKHSVITAHPMGGCRVSAEASNGTVNARGEVYNNAGLYIADASALPGALGLPPSLSIAAWSSHVAQQIIQSSDHGKLTGSEN